MITIKQLIYFIIIFSFFNSYSQNDKRQTFVIVHGAYGGCHNFKGVDSILTAKNNTVHRPCLTGLGEKVHLSSSSIGLQTHILDVINNILYEDIKDVILVGHSYSGMVISGVADSIPNRIKKMIYLDAVIPNNGETSLSYYGDKEKEAKKWFEKYLKDGLIYLDSDNFKKKNPPKDEGHPYKTFTDTIKLDNKLTEKIPTSFIYCGDKYSVKRAEERNWPIYKLGKDHNVQWSDPNGLVELLIKIANQ